MTELRLVDMSENLMNYLIMEIKRNKKLTLTAKVHVIDNIRRALKEAENIPFLD